MARRLSSVVVVVLAAAAVAAAAAGAARKAPAGTGRETTAVPAAPSADVQLAWTYRVPTQLGVLAMTVFLLAVAVSMCSSPGAGAPFGPRLQAQVEMAAGQA